MLDETDLGGDWTLTVDPAGPTSVPVEAEALIGRDIPATVPGAVHADLQRAGLIPDPNVDQNEDLVAWVGRTDWTLQRRIQTSATNAERLDLVFEGIDTVARIELDGRSIGTTRNMHRTYRFDVTELRDGEARDLAVRFTSAYTEAEARQNELGRRPNAYPEPFNYIRKMACSFGWDWGLTLVTAGLWRPVRLEAWSTARIASLRPLVDVEGTTGVLTAHLDIERTAQGQDSDLTVRVVVAGTQTTAVVPAGETSTTVRVEVPDVRPWNPRGYGDPHRYDLEVTLSAGEEVLDADRRKIGFRRLELDRTVDEIGSRFTFVVNGQPIFAKGVNWIPDSVLPGTLTRTRYERRLRAAYDANVNLVRVWGGGIYESHDFYDVCDELGLLAWQDFLFACASYPEDEPIKGEVLAEARDNVARLAGHPSLVLWNGNNENLWLHEATEWEKQEGGTLPWGERYYLKWLPEIVAEIDPSRPYSDGSPWSGSWEFEPNDPDHQTMHSWEVWNREDYADYRHSTPRFMSEFGWQAPPAWRTLRDAVTDEPLTPVSPGVLHHQKADDGNGKLARGLAPHFPEPSSFDAWHFLTQLNQVDAVRTGVLHWRANWPRTAGAVMWQLNDLWPVTSWAAIDGEGRYKPLYFAMRDIFADRVLTIEPTADGYVLCAINDTDAVWTGDASVLRITSDGQVLAQQETAVRVPPRSVERIPISAQVALFAEAAQELLVANLRGARAYRFGAEPKDSAIREEPPIIDVQAVDEGLDITVTARTVVRDILVQPDRIHPTAVVDRGFQTLLPGESVVYKVRAKTPLSAADADVDYAVTSLAAVLEDSRTIVQG